MNEEYIKAVQYEAVLIKNKKTTEQTNDLDEVTAGETFSELYDELMQFLEDVPKGKISLENIVRKAKELHYSLNEWEFDSETATPETDWAEQQERDEDNFADDDL